MPASSRVNRKRSRLAEILIGYRENAKLTQQQLSDLTYRLAEEQPDLIPHGIQRVMIVRAEGNVIPMPVTLLILAHALAYALRSRGFESASGDDLYRHLSGVTRAKITARDVSPEAAELDAILAPLNRLERRIVYAGFLASARAQVSEQILAHRAQAEVRRRKAASSPTPDVPPSGAV